MISGWVIKIIVGIALAGVIAFEIGSPLIARAQLSDTAHEAADGAALDLFNGLSVDQAKASAEQIVADKGGKLDKFEVDANGNVKVTLTKKAASVVVSKIEQAKRFYEIKVTVTSERRQR